MMMNAEYSSCYTARGSNDLLEQKKKKKKILPKAFHLMTENLSIYTMRLLFVSAEVEQENNAHTVDTGFYRLFKYAHVRFFSV